MKQVLLHQLIISIYCTVVQTKISAKLLDFVLDAYLSWSVHVSELNSELSKKLYIFLQFRQILVTELLKKAHFAIFMPI